MADIFDLGKKGEDLAADYLRKKGYRILKRNWRSGRNEVDIIADNNEYIVFVEVKTRSGIFLWILLPLLQKKNKGSWFTLPTVILNGSMYLKSAVSML